MMVMDNLGFDHAKVGAIPKMFEHLAGYRTIIVSGPQRSGTTLGAQAIAQDTGHRYVREEEINVSNLDKLDDLIAEEPHIVVQCPAISRWVHQYSGKNTLVVFMIRDVADIIKSQERINWTGRHEPNELERYEESKGPVAEVKYKFWNNYQKPFIENYLEIDYESLVAHPLWVPQEKRGDWHPRQWYIGQRF